MAGERIAGKALRGTRSRAKPTVTGEAGCAVETGRSMRAVVRRCAEARAMPVPVEPEILPPLAQKRSRGTSAEQCGKRIQREMSRAMPQICEMLLEETILKKNLAALRAMLQMAAFYGVNRAAGVKSKASRVSDAGFARRMLEALRQRNEAAAKQAERSADTDFQH